MASIPAGDSDDRGRAAAGKRHRATGPARDDVSDDDVGPQSPAVLVLLEHVELGHGEHGAVDTRGMPIAFGRVTISTPVRPHDPWMRVARSRDAAVAPTGTGPMVGILGERAVERVRRRAETMQPDAGRPG